MLSPFKFGNGANSGTAAAIVAAQTVVPRNVSGINASGKSSSSFMTSVTSHRE